MTNKITNVNALDYVLENYELPTEYVAKLTAMKATFERKSSGTTRALTSTQKANIELKKLILEKMEDKVEYSASDIARICGLDSNQKASAMLRQMVNEKTVERKESKRKAVFVKIGE